MRQRIPENACQIRYIKLGREASHWKRCLTQNLIWVGFDSGTPDVYLDALSGRWDEIYRYWSSRCKTPRHHTNQTKAFFEDSGDTLWVTFEDGCLYYAFSDGSKPIPDQLEGTKGCIRHTDANGWRNCDARSAVLRIDALSGRLTKTAAYRQTICSFDFEVEQYLRRRLAGKVNPMVTRFHKNRRLILGDIEKLIAGLRWQDFETLIELIFSQSGLRRVSRTGGTKKTTDIDLINPVTSETAFVQVKSHTSQKQLSNYIDRKLSEKSNVDKMYYVFHTGHASTTTEDIVVWDRRDVAAQVFSLGLTDWLVSKSI
ncbi:MAG: restriction endonuclease [Gammaproteobacteria bacterium]|nr:restriction endonuclease [Gammaproteobacteria bacterium]